MRRRLPSESIPTPDLIALYECELAILRCFGGHSLYGGRNRLQDALILVGLDQSWVWHLAAFLAGLPSKGQEIDVSDRLRDFLPALTPAPALDRNHHTPGTNRKRTRCAYAAYPGSSACSVRSSQTVRIMSNSEPKPAGINAHQEPSDNAMPTKRRTAAK